MWTYEKGQKQPILHFNEYLYWIHILIYATLKSIKSTWSNVWSTTNKLGTYVRYILIIYFQCLNYWQVVEILFKDSEKRKWEKSKIQYLNAQAEFPFIALICTKTSLIGANKLKMHIFHTLHEKWKFSIRDFFILRAVTASNLWCKIPTLHWFCSKLW